MNLNMQAIGDRIERLERENRRLKLTGIAALVLMLAVVLMGQAQPSRTLEANRIIVRDSAGRPRITLGTPASSGAAVGMKRNDPAIWMTDEKGTDRMILTMDGIKLADERGKPLASASR